MKTETFKAVLLAALLSFSHILYAAEEVVENCNPRILVKLRSASAAQETTKRGIPGVAIRRVNSGTVAKLDAIMTKLVGTSKTLSLSGTVNATYLGSLPFAANYAVAEFKENLSCAKLNEIAQKIAEDLQVEGTSVDRVPRLHQAPSLPNLPNDSYFQSNQWWSGSPAYGGVNLEAVWLNPNARWMSETPINIAVIDSGVTQHPDLSGVFLPGYDFVSKVSPLVDANNPGSPVKAGSLDGDAEDSNSLDMGLWWDQNSPTCTSTSSPSSNSNWHGTSVSSVIAGRGNNGLGLAGVNWGAKIVPVRVIGGCSSSNSLLDVAKSIYWAAGFEVEVAQGSSIVSTKNNNPVRIINLSLGGPGIACTSGPITDLIRNTINSGTILVVAAGNWGSGTTVFPANCPGVIAVAGSTQKNTNPAASQSELASTRTSATVELAATSSYNSYVSIAAPYSKILVARNPGVKWSITPISESYPNDLSNYALSSGTSFSAPIVSGIISLMLIKNPALSREQVIDKIKQTATPWSANSNCQSTSAAQYQKCGAGVINAEEALVAVSTAPTVVLPAASINSASSYTLSPTITDDRYAVSSRYTYNWQQTNGTYVTLSSISAKSPSFQAPFVSTGSQVLSFRLTVTDDSGLSTVSNVKITVNANSNSAGGSNTPTSLTLAANMQPNNTLAAQSDFQINFTVTKTSGLADTSINKIVILAPKGSVALKEAAKRDYFCSINTSNASNDVITCNKNLAFDSNTLSRSITLNTPIGGALALTMQVASRSGLRSNSINLGNAGAARRINPDVSGEFAERTNFSAGKSFKLNFSATKGDSNASAIGQVIISAPPGVLSLPLTSRLFNRCEQSTSTTKTIISCAKSHSFSADNTASFSINLAFASSAASTITYQLQLENSDTTSEKTLVKPAGE